MKIKHRYDPRKVLYHKDRVLALLKGEICLPVCVEIDPADGFCNQRCKDCSFESGPSKKLQLIDSSILIPTIHELGEAGVRGIEWVGGSEPTLHPNISFFITTAHSSGVKNGLITNGVLLHRVLQNAQNNELEYIRISLDAASRDVYKGVHGTDHFDLVISNIKKLLSSGVDPKKIGLSFRIMKENVCDIVDAAKLVQELGVDYVQYKYSIIQKTLLPSDLEKEILSELEKVESLTEIDSNKVLGTQMLNANLPNSSIDSCISSPLVAVIEANGDISFCIQHRGNPEFNIGNIKDGFLDVWGNDKHKGLYDKAKRKRCDFICKHHRYDGVITRYNPEVVAIEVGKDINIDFC